MMYDKAKLIASSLLQEDSFPKRASINTMNKTTESFTNEEKDFYQNLIDKWLLTTQAIKFNAKKLTESLSLSNSYSVVLSILDSNPSLFRISEDKYISKNNLKTFCQQLIYHIKQEASNVIDLFKTEFELNELISTQYKKYTASLILEELKANQDYDINYIQNFGFFIPSPKFKPIPINEAQAILNAKKVLYLTKVSPAENQTNISVCESFLNSVQASIIDSDLCQKVLDIRPNIQIFPVSCSSVNFSPPTFKSNSNFPFSKSSSDLKEYPIVFKDTEVYIDDFKSLRGKSWLNDRIIHMYGRIVESKHKDVFFIPPCTVQFIRFKSASEVNSVIKSWNLSTFSMVFIPFTNSESARDPGNHWSLLVWFPKNGNKFFHCDSYQDIPELSRSSQRSAVSIVNKLTRLCKLKKSKILRPKVPQQDNSYDCGLYLLAYIDFLVEKRTFNGMENEITHEKIAEMRSAIERRILDVGK